MAAITADSRPRSRHQWRGRGDCDTGCLLRGSLDRVMMTLGAAGRDRLPTTRPTRYIPVYEREPLPGHSCTIGGRAHPGEGEASAVAGELSQPSAASPVITSEDIRRAFDVIRPYLRRTPVVDVEPGTLA